MSCREILHWHLWSFFDMGNNNNIDDDNTDVHEIKKRQYCGIIKMFVQIYSSHSLSSISLFRKGYSEISYDDLRPNRKNKNQIVQEVRIEQQQHIQQKLYELGQRKTTREREDPRRLRGARASILNKNSRSGSLPARSLT